MIVDSDSMCSERLVVDISGLHHVSQKQFGGEGVLMMLKADGLRKDSNCSE